MNENSNFFSGKQIGHSGNIRVCTFCYGSYQSVVEQSDAAQAAPPAPATHTATPAVGGRRGW